MVSLRFKAKQTMQQMILGRLADIYSSPTLRLCVCVCKEKHKSIVQRTAYTTTILHAGLRFKL